jgi:beta-phosphoglucomutase-like phosphatase (HAD superfamily)
MIKAVLFDMDGILFDTEIVMKEGWQKAARELNFNIFRRCAAVRFRGAESCLRSGFTDR